MNVCMHETNREGRKKSPQGGGSSRGLIGPPKAAQSNLRGVRRNLTRDPSTITHYNDVYMNDFYYEFYPI